MKTVEPRPPRDDRVPLYTSAREAANRTYKGKALYRWFNADKPLDGVGMAAGNWQLVKQP